MIITQSEVETMEIVNGILRGNGYWQEGEYHCDCDTCNGGICKCDNKYFLSDVKVEGKVEELFKSDKKTCTQEKLLATLEAIYTFTSSEGEGGRIGYGYSEGYCGTGLRHPSMPLYNLPRNQRRAILTHLESKGLITINKDDTDEWHDLELTKIGLEIEEAFSICEQCHTKKEWYQVNGYVQTDVRSGYSTKGKARLCECKKKEYNKSASSSHNSNIRFGLGEKIIPRTINKQQKEEKQNQEVQTE